LDTVSSDDDMGPGVLQTKKQKHVHVVGFFDNVIYMKYAPNIYMFVLKIK